MPSVITELEQATPDWLADVLAANGFSARVKRLTFEPLMRGNSRIIPLEVAYVQPGDAPTRLILKLSADKNQDRREVDFYSAVTGIRDLPIIRCYEAVYEDGRFHIVMEDLRATHRSHSPSFLPPPLPDAEYIVDALAQFHAYWWDASQLASRFGTLPTEHSIRESVTADTGLLPDFFDFLGDRLSNERKRVLERASERLLDLKLERLASGGRLTLIHADLHAGNFLYPHNPQTDTLRLIDWKSWSIRPGANDMANLMAVYWTQERRQQLQDRLLRRYFEQLAARGVKGYSWENCWGDYRRAVIGYLFFPIWQWSVGTPDFIWWHNFDRLMLAHHDLDCEELL